MKLLLTCAIAASFLLTLTTAEDGWSWNAEPEDEKLTGEIEPSASEALVNIANDTRIDEVIEDIIASGRQGRNLKEYDEIYSDPGVREALESGGDEREARNVIKERLCSLGLMQCDGPEEKRPYIAPEDLVYAQPVDIKPIGQPIPSIPIKSPGRAIYGPPKPVPFPNKGGRPFQGPPPRRYGPPPTKPFYGPPPSKPVHIFETPEQSRPPFNEAEYDFDHGPNSFYHHKDVKKPVPIPVSTDVQQHVHHHFHHNADADGATKLPTTSGFKPNVFSGSYGGQVIGSVKPVVEQVGPQQFGGSTSALYGNDQSGSNYGAGLGSYGASSFGTSVGSYGNSGFYKKELNVGGLQSNALSGGGGYDKYPVGSASGRTENYDCVCVPYDQCPAQDVIGRKEDLYLPLDPRNVKSDIEAEEDRVVTDGNGTMTVVRVAKGAELNLTNATEQPEKKVAKREAEKKEEGGKAEARQAFYGNSVQQTCGPRHVCCKRPLRPLVPGARVGQCGVRHSQGINGRIKNPVYVDGDSEFGEYPWQVAILKKDPKESVYVCGGTLIDALHIITAAHCVKTYSPYDLRVRLGEWDVNHDVEFFPYVERDAVQVHVHPEFYAGTLYNDLAVIRMDKPVDLTKYPHISPACLPSPHEDYTGHRCWTTGWGKDAFGDFGKYQNILKEVDVPIVGHADCQQRLQHTRLGYDFKLHPGFICAGGEEGKDACKGDGGGPMVCERGGTWKVVGIVSWGIGCGQNGVPGVYVKVGHYADWIRQLTNRF